MATPPQWYNERVSDFDKIVYPLPNKTRSKFSIGDILKDKDPVNSLSMVVNIGLNVYSNVIQEHFDFNTQKLIRTNEDETSMWYEVVS